LVRPVGCVFDATLAPGDGLGLRLSLVALKARDPQPVLGGRGELVYVSAQVKWLVLIEGPGSLVGGVDYRRTDQELVADDDQACVECLARLGPDGSVARSAAGASRGARPAGNVDVRRRARTIVHGGRNHVPPLAHTVVELADCVLVRARSKNGILESTLQQSSVPMRLSGLGWAAHARLRPLGPPRPRAGPACARFPH
jgi:hypothetical protein